MSIKNDMRQIIKAAKKRGWVVEQNRRSGHYMLTWVDGRKVTASLSPSDYHAPKNCAADLKRIENSSVDTG